LIPVDEKKVDANHAAIANALSTVAVWLKYLGAGENGSHMGAVEWLAKQSGDGLDKVAERVGDGLDGLREELGNALFSRAVEDFGGERWSPGNIVDAIAEFTEEHRNHVVSVDGLAKTLSESMCAAFLSECNKTMDGRYASVTDGLYRLADRVGDAEGAITVASENIREGLFAVADAIRSLKQ
jgi:hypothetical protein